MSQLPEFRKARREEAMAYARTMLTNEHQTPPISHLLDVVAHEAGYFRVLFDPKYFILPEDQDAPTKSQWNSLKKKFKRHNRLAFVLKEHGETQFKGNSVYWLEFGYFAR